MGLKSRECYEVPGALTLITAHKALEDICVEGDLLKTKIKLEQDWATAVYNGQWFSPLKERARRLYGRHPEVRDRHRPSEVL